MNVMKAIFKSFLISLAIISQVHFAYAQSGAIIPNSLNVFLDNNGKPLSSGQVFFYAPSTTTPKSTFSDINLTIPNTNPVILDAAGRPNGSKGLWGNGVYRQVVKDKNNNLIWDQTTSTGGSGGSGPTATGDGDAVGTLRPWPGAVAPNQYMFTYGQELNRVTYAPLFQAITSQQPVFCTSTSPILTGVGNTDSFWIGMKVEVACVSGGVSTVLSKTSSSVTLNANANVSTNTTATFFMWGNGNGSTTFNLPDYRGLIPMGNNIMGGTAGINISDTNFGPTSASSAGALGGDVVHQGAIVIQTTNLPPYTPSGSNGTVTVTGPNGHNMIIDAALSAATAGGGTPVWAGGATSTSTQFSGSGPTFTGVAQGGTSSPLGIIPPSKTVNFIIKVTPDTAFSGTGVTSLGGMTGDILCGAGLTCAGATISSSSSGLTINSTSVAGANSNGILLSTAGILQNTNAAANAVLNTDGSNNPSLTQTPVLGTSGVSAGSLSFANSSTGTVKIQPPSGALGTAVATLLTGTYNFVGDTSSQTLTNKTLTAPSISSPAFTGTATGTNVIPYATLQTIGAFNLIGNTTGSTAASAGFSITGLTNKTTPASTDVLLLSDQAASGALKFCTISQCISAVSAGVTSLNGATGAVVLLTQAQGRLTLQSNTPVMTTSQSAQTTLRYDCYIGNQVPYYTGSADSIDTVTSCEVTDAMVSAASAGQVVSNNLYDVWWVHGGANRICLAMSTSTGGGGGWSADVGGSNTVRGTGYTQLDRSTRPYTTNKNSITNCFNGATNYGPVSANQGTYLGTGYASANGQISFNIGAAASGGTAALLGIWNMYNRVEVAAFVQDTGTSYTYTSATVRQARASAGMQVQFILGLVEDSVTPSYLAEVTYTSNIGSNGGSGIGLDTTSAYTYPRSLCTNPVAAAFTCDLTSSLTAYTGAGLHTLSLNEASDGTHANTFDANSTNFISTHLRM